MFNRERERERVCLCVSKSERDYFQGHINNATILLDTTSAVLNVLALIFLSTALDWRKKLRQCCDLRLRRSFDWNLNYLNFIVIQGVEV